VLDCTWIGALVEKVPFTNKEGAYLFLVESKGTFWRKVPEIESTNTIQESKKTTHRKRDNI
jgi:hypothetical protein